ncbi:MAG TPA: inositol monophosphatase [Rhizobiaceae bacterium]|nr:inositol monophosphatase [Rhizobiaceae bacterium]
MRFDEKDIGWLADLLARAADQEIMPRFRRLGGDDVQQKTSAADLVTVADVNAERAITAALSERYPDALIVGEEAYERAPGLLDGLASADLAFVIDPIDGTFNFASGTPLFGVMLAVVAAGETVAGLIYDPVGREWLTAVRGAGGRCLSSSGEGVACRVAERQPLSESTGSVSWQSVGEPLRSRLARNQGKSLAQVGYRCAAHEYRMLALGHMQFALYNKLMPWDHLAGVLIHAEAGGYSACLDGSPYRPGDTEGGLLLTPDKASWDEFRRELLA